MKQGIKIGENFKDAGNIRNYTESIATYKKVAEQNPRDTFSRYYLAAVNLNHSFNVVNLENVLGNGEQYRSDLK